jgi:cytoskeletal protein CcmA (bactofilin family)
MFGRKKGGASNRPGDAAAAEDTGGAYDPADEAGYGSEYDAEDGEAITAPPLKPFARRGSHAPAKPPSVPFRGDRPRPGVEIPRAPARGGERGRPGIEEPGKKQLTVGRDISLQGEITACDRLVVEGTVQAQLTDARTIEVAPTGTFKGSADVEEADISGRYEGDLIARGRLTVRASGRISGSVRYGALVVEEGGEITGTAEALSASRPRSVARAAAQPTTPSEKDAEAQAEDSKAAAVGD